MYPVCGSRSSTSKPTITRGVEVLRGHSMICASDAVLYSGNGVDRQTGWSSFVRFRKVTFSAKRIGIAFAPHPQISEGACTDGRDSGDGSIDGRRSGWAGFTQSAALSASARMGPRVRVQRAVSS
ncbi:hypothetical protein J1614_004976 [Plenodomus biglobosus]|nr:hypothetical protein J1614_004976 [Plenodomus biglobosus]